GGPARRPAPPRPPRRSGGPPPGPPHDALATFRLLVPHVDAVELNASCPNVSWGRDRDTEAHLRELLVALRGRPVPLFVKLPPFRTQVERDVVLALAAIAQEGGADGLTCANTVPVEDARLAVGRGGLSGSALSAQTPGIVAAVAAATHGELPNNACGGIASVADALACLEAGATTVQIYTGLLHGGPGLPARLARGIARPSG
ncbi:MAG: dihydroorotate dehydrogenase, partial [Actinomycetota bacterium]